ncbi:hypothetical protein DOY81_005637 [Sarcophaga bullata]|nr:hypothetical protein DOY81_005637 [Sarcophaga bullata]
MLRKVPLIVILGSTGTGKTKLSLELAERFGGEIISADSMQVYANLDIATAKATREEQSRAKHHLLDVATPNEPFTVVHFRNKALPIIENLLAQSQSPIVVGGTNYYIESLLWDILVSPSSSRSLTETDDDFKHAADDVNDNGFADVVAANAVCKKATSDNTPATVSGNLENPSLISTETLLTMSSELLHNHLKQIDPETANRIHPNNKRKIMRAIEYYQQTGQRLSAKLKEQREQPGGNRLGGPLRYPHTILFWLRCNQDVLNKRLDKRVDAMLEQGLLREIRAFHNEHNHFGEFYWHISLFFMLIISVYEGQQLKLYAGSKNNTNKTDTNPNDADILNTIDPKDQLPPGLDVLNSCLNELKLVTRRYSKKQIKWINNRFLASRDRQVPDLYELDTTDVSQWHTEVYSRAVNIIDCYRNGQVCEIEPMQKRQHPGAGLNEETSNYCKTCERHFIGEYQWQLHLKSNKHKRRKERLRKKANITDSEVSVTGLEMKDNETK